LVADLLNEARSNFAILTIFKNLTDGGVLRCGLLAVSNDGEILSRPSKWAT